MRDHDRTGDADPRQRLVDELGLARRRGVGAAAGPVAPPVAGTVNQDDTIVRSQPIADGEAHLTEIVAGSCSSTTGGASGAPSSTR